MVLAILDPLDFLALQSLKKSLHDLPGSSFFSAWDFTSDPCTFPGVFCESDKVVALSLGESRAGSPGLTGRLHPSLGNLASLTALSIVPGKVFGRLPDSLSLCTNLTVVAIAGNYLYGEIPTSFSNLRSLETIDLGHNQLGGAIPWSLGELPALTTLILSHNRLSGAVPPFFSANLLHLDLGHNSFSGELTPYSLPPSLLYLSVTGNRLVGQVVRLLPRLTQLNHLDLSMNRFTGQVPAEVFAVRSLSALFLHRNRFTGPVQPVAQVEIQTIDISYNQFNGRISPLLSTVQNLYLNNNRFTGPVPKSVIDRLLGGKIRTLYLQHNFLTSIDIKPTAGIPQSSSLCLNYNCLVPPVQTVCPAKAGTVKTRPPDQCKGVLIRH